MYKLYSAIIGLMCFFNTANLFANCNLSQFRDECSLRGHLIPSAKAHSLVYCGNTIVYLSKTDYDTFSTYRRSLINMDLMVNGEFVESPCVPSERE